MDEMKKGSMKQEAKGLGKQIKGKINEVAGAIKGDTAQELKGKGQQVVGKGQQKLGAAGRKISNAVNDNLDL